MILRVLDCSGSTMAGADSVSFLLDGTVLLDAGSAASVLTLEEQCAVSDVFLTHAHLDHVKGLPFLAENVLGRRDGPVTVRAAEDTIGKLRRHLLNGEIWPDFTRIPDETSPVLRYAPIADGETVRVGGLAFDAIPMNHPGGCSGFLVAGGSGTLAFSGDTGPTEEFWAEIRRRGDAVTDIIVETSFPNRLGDVAERSGHLTPRTLAVELDKLGDVPGRIHVHAEKAPTRDETRAEIVALPGLDLGFLEPGMVLEI
jgi:glyoxylase-like metal-dependent hydrolase (beta-lactamase superfamily II)